FSSSRRRHTIWKRDLSSDVCSFDLLTPIICVGESLEQREANENLNHIEFQIKQALANLKNDQIQKTIIAYEPIWAIGTGKTATHEKADEVIGHLRSVIGVMANYVYKE